MAALGLQAHPSTPCPAVASLTVDVVRERDLHLRYDLRGDLAAIALPAPAGSGFADGLWRHTCFEAFLAGDDGGPYYELNFSPSGRWAAYAFAAYRQRAELDPMLLTPTMSWRRGEGHLALAVAVPLAALPATPRRLGLSAVIETRAGAVSYWALAHPGGRPDFHHADGFALRLEAC